MTSRTARPLNAASLILIAAIALTASLEARGADDAEARWRFLTKDTPYSIRYFERGPAPQTPGGLRTVWTRTIPTAEGNPQISEIRSLWEIDCARRAFRSVRTVIIYSNGASEETQTPRDWTEAQPGIWVGKLSETVCTEDSAGSQPESGRNTQPR